MTPDLIAIFAFGVVFVGALLLLAIRFPHPSDFQYLVFRIVLALASAGIAALIPGFLEIELQTWLKAGGALAVFAIVYFKSPANLVKQGTANNSEGQEASLHRLEQAWKGVNYINCDSLVGPDVNKAGNALQMTAMYWKNNYLDKKVIVDQYGGPFCELYEQLNGCNKQVPGYNNPVKHCKDFLSNIVRETYNEVKDYGI